MSEIETPQNEAASPEMDNQDKTAPAASDRPDNVVKIEIDHGAAKPEQDLSEQNADEQVDEQADQLAGPAAQIEVLEAQVADLNDKLLRAMAETENVRRRAQRDKEDASKYAIKSFAEQMITVLDNLGRALQSVDADARSENPALENIVVGIDMVVRDLVNGFDRFGVKPIEALGQKFDPMLHEAMYEVENTDVVVGTVAQVLETGYTLNGRTLRAAKVGITKGGPKIAAAIDPESTDPDTESSDASADAGRETTREGQGAYESKGKDPGSQLDQEL